jgi:hypothetical protein
MWMIKNELKSRRKRTVIGHFYEKFVKGRIPSFKANKSTAESAKAASLNGLRGRLSTFKDIRVDLIFFIKFTFLTIKRYF